MTITKEELVAVEEIGPTMADSIVEYRQDPTHVAIIEAVSYTHLLQFDVNREKAAQDGVALADIFTTLQGFYGSIQVNDFTMYGKNYKVVVQAEDAYRQNADRLNMLAVRNSKGLMVPVSNYITKEQTGLSLIHIFVSVIWIPLILNH